MLMVKQFMIKDIEENMEEIYDKYCRYDKLKDEYNDLKEKKEYMTIRYASYIKQVGDLSIELKDKQKEIDKLKKKHKKKTRRLKHDYQSEIVYLRQKMREQSNIIQINDGFKKNIA
jgi:uncharacterized protein involved in exopolysaccharide biosynthesis